MLHVWKATADYLTVKLFLINVTHGDKPDEILSLQLYSDVKERFFLKFFIYHDPVSVIKIKLG